MCCRHEKSDPIFRCFSIEKSVMMLIFCFSEEDGAWKSGLPSLPLVLSHSRCRIRTDVHTHTPAQQRTAHKHCLWKMWVGGALTGTDDRRERERILVNITIVGSSDGKHFGSGSAVALSLCLLTQSVLPHFFFRSFSSPSFFQSSSRGIREGGSEEDWKEFPVTCQRLASGRTECTTAAARCFSASAIVDVVQPFSAFV